MVNCERRLSLMRKKEDVRIVQWEIRIFFVLKQKSVLWTDLQTEGVSAVLKRGRVQVQ